MPSMKEHLTAMRGRPQEQPVIKESIERRRGAHEFSRNPPRIIPQRALVADQESLTARVTAPQLMHTLKTQLNPRIIKEDPISVKESPLTTVSIFEEDPWSRIKRLGDERKGDFHFTIATMEPGIVMYKKIVMDHMDEETADNEYKPTEAANIAKGRKEFAILRSFAHENVISVHDSFIYNEIFYLGYENAQFTLFDIVATSSVLPLLEKQIQHIARSV
jgi:hypothetical protein